MPLPLVTPDVHFRRAGHVWISQAVIDATAETDHDPLLHIVERCYGVTAWYTHSIPRAATSLVVKAHDRALLWRYDLSQALANMVIRRKWLPGTYRLTPEYTFTPPLGKERFTEAQLLNYPIDLTAALYDCDLPFRQRTYNRKEKPNGVGTREAAQWLRVGNDQPGHGLSLPGQRDPD